jgi:hypothetical protein
MLHDTSSIIGQKLRFLGVQNNIRLNFFKRNSTMTSILLITEPGDTKNVSESRNMCMKLTFFGQTILQARIQTSFLSRFDAPK